MISQQQILANRAKFQVLIGGKGKNPPELSPATAEDSKPRRTRRASRKKPEEAPVMDEEEIAAFAAHLAHVLEYYGCSAFPERVGLARRIAELQFALHNAHVDQMNIFSRMNEQMEEIARCEISSKEYMKALKVYGGFTRQLNASARQETRDRDTLKETESKMWYLVRQGLSTQSEP